MSQASIKAVPVARHHGVFWRAVLLPLRILFWPLVKVVGFLDKNFVSYLTGRVLRDESRVYNVKFIWYGESVYLHPMIWGSLIMYALAATNIVAPGWLLLFWFLGLCLSVLRYGDV